MNDIRHGVYIVRTATGRVLGHHEASCSNEALAVVRAECRNERVKNQFAAFFAEPIEASQERFDADLAGATADWVHPGPEQAWLATLPE